ncbi:hypothetical protein A2814_00985 [Candidatus Nomurabacteria bacterium RIFCSPHIGHO2_01_FULL_38_19]|uniref:D-alanine--D-alanine ligase C-terminal domain-containing protein n=1 Tax=Candidatus Nomurabacteria bacterium RIFCSPHIGHO2_01_FULL_38_19 TaxID=1801732 RepID=A0A1F6URD2_9BACT|nr:MAG: hypothetical protein A2814_00985 [Candidatus Nomurabacteria bacterium RIFCSPHIGHO2_01_FULL_38_19]
MEIKRVGIIRGGIGETYTSSLRQGGEIISHIAENLGDKYKTFDILIDKEGSWHLNGLSIKPSDLVRKVDVVWNTAEPSISTTLDNFSIPNVGNNSFSSALENNNNILRKYIKNIGVEMPRSVILPTYQKDFDPRYAEGSGEASGPRERYSIKKAKEVFEKFSSPWLVKSLTPDASMAIHVAKTFPQLVDAIEDGVKHKKSILVEEFIIGFPSVAHSIGNFRGEDVYVLPPENLTQPEKENIIVLTKKLHKHLNAKHYLKFDFTLNPRRGIFLTNASFTPDFRSGSHLEKSCESVGVKMHHLVEHILNKALKL